MSIIRPSVVGEFVRRSVPGPGFRYVFSEDLILERYEGLKPGQGLPKKKKNRLAGSHSGFVTTLRIAKGKDRLYPKGSYLFQYEGTFKFNTVPNTPLKQGQVTARGIYYGYVVDGEIQPIEPPLRVAITGGTEVYRLARGQITERVPNPENKLLEIEL